MKNFFSDYGFDRNVSFVSKVTTSGFRHNTKKNTAQKHKIDLYGVESFDNSVPLNSVIFEGCYKEKINFDGDVVLSFDYTSGMPIIIENNAVKVNLNGKNVIAPIFSESNGLIKNGNTDSYAFWVKKGAELTIEGNGDVIAQEADYSMAVWANGGDVIIKGGNFYNNGNNSDLIYASAGSTVKIYGGEFHANKNEGASGTKNQYPALNIKDKDRETTKIIVYGGVFYGFNPADNVSEGSNTNFVADGYKSIEIEENVWKFVKE